MLCPARRFPFSFFLVVFFSQFESCGKRLLGIASVPAKTSFCTAVFVVATGLSVGKLLLLVVGHQTPLIPTLHSPGTWQHADWPFWIVVMH